MTISHPPPFFIMGCPRSGTTLVSQLLDSHSRISVFVESLYYTLFRDILRYYGDLSQPQNARHLCDDLIEMISLRKLDRTGVPSAHDLMAELETASFAGILSTFLSLYAGNRGKVRGGEKTARHYEFLPQILDEFPHSPIIFVMRDPRDVMVSAQKMFGISVHQAIHWWNKAFESYEYLENHVRPVCLVRYEDLVVDTQSALEKLCAHLGEAFEPDMLGFFQVVPEKLASLPHHSRLASSVTPSSVGSFKTLTEAQIGIIEANCGRGMSAMGYAPTSRHSGASAELRSADELQIVRTWQRLYRVLRRPDLRFLGWRRWKMRQRARFRYALRIGMHR